MAKAAAQQPPELFAPLSSGPDKGMRNQAKSKVKERPSPPGPISPPSGGSSGKAAPAKKHELVIHEGQPKSDIALMIEAIRDPGFDPAKAKALCDLRDHEEDRALQRQKLHAEIDFNDALARAKSKMPAVIGVDRENPHSKSKYATLEKVSKTMDKIIGSEGFTISYGMAESSIADHYRITAKLSRGLHSRDYFIDLPADTKGAKGNDNKTPVQGIGSTISYGRRYLKLMMFDVVVGREDDDGQGGNTDKITEEQADELLRMCADKNIGADLFSKAFGVSSFADLPARRFEEAKSRLALAPAQQAKPKQQEQNHDEG